MVMERPPKVNPPSGRVPGQVLLAIPRSESLWRRNSGRNRVTGLSSRVSVSGAKYMPKGGLRGGTPGPSDQRARPRPGRARQPPGLGVAPLGASFGLLESSVLHIFYMIFLEFSEHFYF